MSLKIFKNAFQIKKEFREIFEKLKVVNLIVQLCLTEAVARSDVLFYRHRIWIFLKLKCILSAPLMFILFAVVRVQRASNKLNK